MTECPQGDVDIRAQAERVNELKGVMLSLIAVNGLGTVLQTLREVCYDKANYIAVHGQNVALAKRWIAAGLYVNSAVQKTTV